MNELILNNVTYDKNNNRYVAKMTIGQYLNLIQEDFIKSDDLDGYHRIVSVAEMYNNDKQIKVIPMDTISLILINNGINQVETKENNKKFIYDKIEILDGLGKTLLIKHLDKRFYNQKILVNIYYADIKQARQLLL